MNRREFLKLVGSAGIVALVPKNFIVDNRDPETKFLGYIVQTYDEAEVCCLIKSYGYAASYGPNFSTRYPGGMTRWLSDFVKRQPEVVAWLRSRIKFTTVVDDSGNKKRLCSSERYERSVRGGTKETNWWHNWACDTYPPLADHFGLPKSDRYERWD